MLSTDLSNAKPACGQQCVVPKTSASEPRPPVFNSADLLQGCREAWIEHGEQMYRLRLTAAGKLYLTK